MVEHTQVAEREMVASVISFSGEMGLHGLLGAFALADGAGGGGSDEAVAPPLSPLSRR
jgi:hypothetical protein